MYQVGEITVLGKRDSALVWYQVSVRHYLKVSSV